MLWAKPAVPTQAAAMWTQQSETQATAPSSTRAGPDQQEAQINNTASRSRRRVDRTSPLPGRASPQQTISPVRRRKSPRRPLINSTTSVQRTGGTSRNFWDASSSDSEVDSGSDSDDESGASGFESSDDEGAASPGAATHQKSDEINDEIGALDGAPTPPPRVQALSSHEIETHQVDGRAQTGVTGVLAWNEGDVSTWLRNHGLGAHAEVFTQQGLDGPALLALGHELGSVDWTTAAQICGSLGLTRVGECAKFRAQLRELIRVS